MLYPKVPSEDMVPNVEIGYRDQGGPWVICTCKGMSMSISWSEFS